MQQAVHKYLSALEAGDAEKAAALFVHDGWVAAYQSGFDFGPDADRLRPGLICHLMAIQHYRRAGMRRYDFLGGEARYKRSLANAEIPLVWLDVRHKLPWQSRRQAVSSP